MIPAKVTVAGAIEVHGVMTVKVLAISKTRLGRKYVEVAWTVGEKDWDRQILYIDDTIVGHIDLAFENVKVLKGGVDS